MSAQELTQITGTNLKIILPANCVLDANSAIISNSEYTINFIEMAGANYNEQESDFDTVEKDYAEKGINVIKNIKGKIGEYEARLIKLESRPQIFQAFFGDDNFCALANVIPVDSSAQVVDNEIYDLLNSISYEADTISALEKHANFHLPNENGDWTFQSKVVANTFAFEHNKTKDLLTIAQLPPETLMFVTKEKLAEQFLSRFKADMPNIKVIEQGDWKSDNLDGYKMVLDVTVDGNGNLEMIYLCVFNNEKSTYVFQGIGTKNDLATKERFEAELKTIELK